MRGRVVDWFLDSTLFHPNYFRPCEEVRSDTFRIGEYEFQIFLYPQGSGTDSEYVSIFLKYSYGTPLTCHVSLDGIGPRGLCHDGNGIWGYPTFCPRSFLREYLEPFQNDEKKVRILEGRDHGGESSSSGSDADSLLDSRIVDSQPLAQAAKAGKMLSEEGAALVEKKLEALERREQQSIKVSGTTGDQHMFDRDLISIRGQPVINTSTRRRSHRLRLRFELISSNDSKALDGALRPAGPPKPRTILDPPPQQGPPSRSSSKGKNLFSPERGQVPAVDKGTLRKRSKSPSSLLPGGANKGRNKRGLHRAKTAPPPPNVLEISHTLVELCDLPAARPITTPRDRAAVPAVLWLGGDAASISRFLFAYYLNQLNAKLLYTPHEVSEDVVEEEAVFGIIEAVATGDDELLYLQV